MKTKILFAFFIMMMAVTEASSVEYQPAPSADGVVYVKQTGAGDGSGSSWANAYPELADALLAAKTNANIKQIWVAAGTYKPLYAADGASNDPRDNAFVLVSGLKIYGGFPANANDTDHTSLLTRGLAHLLNATILSGDIDGDNTLTDNAYHVVIGANIPDDSETILDGFTITGGNADDTSYNYIIVNGQSVSRSSGGGIYNDSSPTLTNLTISGNTATEGGGIYNYYYYDLSSPTLTNITISGNKADYGGGIYNAGASPTLTNVTISGNTANFFGGGINNSNGPMMFASHPKLTNSIVWGNSAFYGNNVYNYYDNSPTYTYSLVQDEDLTASGTGNLNGTLPENDPLFVLSAIAPAPTTTGNYRLLSASPLIDKGNNDLYESTTGRVLLSDVDIDGNPRLYGASIDLGAYEYEPVSGSILLYVKQNSTGTGDGSSWANAYPEFADALLAAKSNANIKVIWVAAGTYKPLYPADGASNDSRDKAFVLVNGLKIYGGFPADANDTDHTTISTRGLAPLYDPLQNATILSGDLGDNDTAGDLTANKDDNAYHVVIGANIAPDGETILDGFTITGGSASTAYSGDGGGIYNAGSSPTLTNLTISGNSAGSSGGGIANYSSSSPTLTNVTISGNTAEISGGGMYNSTSSSPTLTNVTISENTARDGGGICNESDSSPTLTNVTISGNMANDGYGGIGGGISNRNSSPTLTNVIISGNTASGGGSGIGGGIYTGTSYNPSLSSPTLTNVTISGNSAAYGGGIANEMSSPKLYNSIVWGNSASTGNNVINWFYSGLGSITYNYSLVQGENLTTTGTGNLNGLLPENDPLFVSPALASAAPTTTGNYRLQAASPLIDKGDNDSYKTASGLAPDLDTDLGGNLRLFGASIDLGAYEYQPIPGADGILHVKQDGTGTGASWADAHPELADALLVAKTNTNIKEIWVAAGTYKPLHPADGASTDPRDNAFVLVSGVKIYGGFPVDANDTDHTSISTRGLAPLYDPLQNATILSGDLESDDDDADDTTRSNNAYHVVIGASIPDDGKTILDGFTITSGSADDIDFIQIFVNGQYVNRFEGGGIYNSSSSPAFTNITISGNKAVYGGGIYNDDYSSPTLTNLTISGNTAYGSDFGWGVSGGYGGGIYNSWESSPTLTNVTISGNTANDGGGIYNDYDSSPTLTNVIISGNKASGNGGGIYNGESSPTLTNVTISGNTASGNGGGIYNGGSYYTSSSPTLTNVTISGNTASGEYDGSGGGIYNQYSSPLLTNVTISGNTASGEYGGSGGGIYNDYNSSPKLTNAIVWGNTASTENNVYNGSTPTYNYSLVQDEDLTGTGIGNFNGTQEANNPLFASPAVASAPTTTGNYRLKPTSPLIDKGNNELYASTTGRVLQSDVDIDGNPRLSGTSIDLGAYEFVGFIWTGIADNKWKEPKNWNIEEIPNASSTVYIPGKLNTYPVLTAADNATVKDVRFGPGAEIGRQDLLDYTKAYVQLDFSTGSLDRDRWYMLANPLQELYAGDFSFGGYPGMDMKLFKTESPQSEKTIWKRIEGLEQSFSAGDGFIVWLAPNPSGKGSKGLILSNGILELPYLDNANVPAEVHWTHHYTTPNSTFGGWKEDNGSIVENGESEPAPRHLDKAYRLAGQTINKTLDAGGDLFAIAGNPYMGSIDFAKLQAANEAVIKGTYHIWIGPGGALGGSYAGYNVFGGAFGREGVNLNNYIAPMQSFIVEKSAGASATATLAFDLEKIGATGGSARLRSAAPQGDKLAIVASTAAAGVRTVIVSRQEGGDSFGPADSRKLFDEINSIPEVYTLKTRTNNEPIATAVNVLGEVTGETLVPLAIATTHKGEINFAFSGMDTYDARIFLLDTETNREIELTDKEQYAYKFDYVPEQSGGKTIANESRFFIRLHKVASSIETIAAAEAVRIFAARPGTLQVVSTHPLHQVIVYNLQGAKVYDAAVRTNTHRIDGLVGGVYIVKVVSGNTVTTEKVIIRN